MLVKFGALIAEGRGAVGTNVFSRNTYGAYVRDRKIPDDKKTAKQLAQRATMSSISSSWKALTDNQRTSWNQQANILTRKNIFGDNLPYTGFNLFMKCSLNAAKFSLSVLTPPWTNISIIPDPPLDVYFDINYPELSLYPSSDTVQADTCTLVESTPAISAGVKFVESEYRVIGFLDESELFNQDFYVRYCLVFPVPVAGNLIFFRVTRYFKNSFLPFFTNYFKSTVINTM